MIIHSCKKTDVKPTEIIQDTSVTDQLEKKIINQIDLDISKIIGTLQPSQDTSFTLISKQHADREGLYMHKEAYVAFTKMYEAAQNDGINLEIRSAARNFDYQKRIWEKKWTGQTILSSGENASTVYPDKKSRALKILEYSSMPGTSRHHWGTDIDLNNFNNSWFESGEGLRLFKWLEKNAHQFGYCRPYTEINDSRPNGYNEEKWHWSYTPISNLYTQYAAQNITNDQIDGFLGSQVAKEINVVENYILGISKNCNH